MFAIAELSALPRVVQHEQLARARSVNETIESLSGLFGPSLGGLIISLGRTQVAGAILAFVVDAISYLVSGLSLSTALFGAMALGMLVCLVGAWRLRVEPAQAR